MANQGVSIDLKLKIPAAVHETRVGVATRLNKAAQLVRAKIVKNLSTPFPPASTPGEFPHARTGKLRQSVNIRPATPENLVAQVGSPLRYASALERGTSKMKARGWLLRTILESRKEIERIIESD